MSEGKSAATPQRIVTHEMAREAFRKMHNALYNHAPKPMLTVPPDPMRDVDMILGDYIRQQSEAGSVAAPKAHSFAEECAAQSGHALIVQCSCGSEFKPQCPDCHEIAAAPKAGEPSQPTKDELDLSVALHIGYCDELAEEGTPWEVPAEPEPQYFETFNEAIVFLWNLPDTSGAGQTPPQLSTWLDTTLWSFVHGALLDLESTTEAHDSLHKHMHGAILAALQVGAGETPAERPMTEEQARKWCDEHRRHPVIGKAVQGAQSWQPDGLATIVAYIFSLPPGAGSTKEGK